MIKILRFVALILVLAGVILLLTNYRNEILRDHASIEQRMHKHSVIDQTWFISTEVVSKNILGFYSTIEYSDIEECVQGDIESIKKREYLKAFPTYKRLKAALEKESRNE
jgi:hypothetical protein